MKNLPLALLCLVNVLAISPRAAGTTWTASFTGTADWYNAANWSAGVPNSGVDALITNIGNANTVGINSGAAAVANLTIAATAGVTSVLANNGATLNTSQLYLGTVAGATAFLTLNNATLTNSSVAYIGESNQSNLELNNGSSATLNTTFLGYNSTGWGIVFVNASSTFQASTLYVGYSGMGTLSVGTGGTANVTSSFALGVQAGSLGVANTFGTLTTNGATIGDSGRGEMTIGSQGSVTSGFTILASQANSSAAVTISASGLNTAVWNTTSLFLGNQGAAEVLIQKGTLNAGAGIIANASLGSGTLTVTGASSAANFSTLNVGNQGVGSVFLQDGGTLTVGSGAGTLTLGATGANGRSTLNIGAAAGQSAIAAGVLNAAAINGVSGANAKIVNFNQTGTVTFAPQLLGTLSVLSSGGTNTLTGNNSYSGGTTLAGGTLGLGSANAIGSSGTISFTGGTLQFSASNTTDYSARFANTSGQVYGIDTNGQSVTFASTVASTGGGSLTKLGAGVLTFSGATDNTALAVVVNAGSVVLGKTSTASVHAIGGGAAVANLVVNSGGTAQLGGTGGDQIYTSAAVQVNAGGHLDLNGRSEGFDILTGAGTVSNSAAATTSTLTIGEFNGSSTLDTALVNGSGTLAFIKAGSGTVTLTGSNSYTGGTTVSGGTLIGTSTSLLGAIVNNATVVFNQATTGTYAGVLSGSGVFTKSGAGALTLSADNSFAGTTNVNAGTLRFTGRAYSAGSNPGAINVNSGGTLLLNRQDILGNHTSASPVGLTINAGGLVSNAGGAVFNTLNNLHLNGGELRDTGGNSSTWPAYQLKGTVTVGGASASQITMPAVTTFNGIQIGSNTGGGTTAFDVADATGSPATDLTISAILLDGRNGVAANVASGLVKTGDGTLTLSGANTYTGPTTINGGRLVVDGSLSASSAVAINNTGTLGGNGTVGAVTINSGGKISPGNSPGTMNTGAETWAGGAGYVWELNNASDAPGAKGVTSDWLNLGGALTITATNGSKFTITITSLTAGNAPGITPGFANGQNYTFPIATAATPITTFSADRFLINTSGFTNDPTNLGGFAIGLSGDNLSLNLTYTAVPEPSTSAAAIAALLGAVILFRRRRA